MTIIEYIVGLPRRVSRLATVGVLSLGLMACGGGGSTDSGSAIEAASSDDEFAKLSVSLTDAEGDFLTYQVDVTNISLTRSNGAVINLLPQTTTIDFAQYVEVTELLTILDAPAGRYDSASMSLDFSNAQVTVQNDAGEPVLADVVDEEGQALSEVTVEIMFNDQSGFVLRPGVPAQITLDFDLDASNTIEINGDTATVTVQPLLIADTILEEPKPFRLRGLLARVDIDESSFTMDLRPFRARSGAFGSADVQTTEATGFEVDGVVLNVVEGLAALEDKDSGTAIVTEGEWDRDAREYVATAVYAGSSVPWDQADILRGTVAAREGNILSVRGAIVHLSTGSFVFNDTFTVELADTTIVTKRGEDESSIADISVGSAIYATGVVTDSSMNSAEGIVRIKASNIAGTVVSVSPLIMDLIYINGRRGIIYDFSGTGTSVDTDADPDNYEVNTSTLDLSGVVVGDPIRARGFAADFGVAPEDFYASTLAEVAHIRGHMVINYGSEGSVNAITSIDESGVQLDITDSPFRHHILIAGIPLNLESLDLTPLVVPGGERGVYTIWIDGRLEVYTFYAEFVEAIEGDLGGGASVVKFDAQGFFDRALNTFTSKRFGVVLNNEG